MSKINFVKLKLVEEMEARTELLNTAQRRDIRWAAKECFRASKAATSFEEADAYNADGCYYSDIADESAEHRSIRRQRGRIGWTADHWDMAEEAV